MGAHAILKYILVVASLAVSVPISAEILAVCGASEGHGYYIPGEFVPLKESGWMRDSIRGGAFQLLRNGDEYDIIFTDASGGTLSSKGDGGEVLGFVNSKGDIIVTVLYQSVIETYAFWFSSPGPLIATFAQVKHGTPIRKHAVFKAQCRRLVEG